MSSGQQIVTNSIRDLALLEGLEADDLVLDPEGQCITYEKPLPLIGGEIETSFVQIFCDRERINLEHYPADIDFSEMEYSFVQVAVYIPFQVSDFFHRALVDEINLYNASDVYVGSVEYDPDEGRLSVRTASDVGLDCELLSGAMVFRMVYAAWSVLFDFMCGDSILKIYNQCASPAPETIN